MGWARGDESLVGRATGDGDGERGEVGGWRLDVGRWTSFFCFVLFYFYFHVAFIFRLVFLFLCKTDIGSFARVLSFKRGLGGTETAWVLDWWLVKRGRKLWMDPI
ncbi:hypothetical protein M430DRAFT_169347 [Amorphotheca resinae ATCC 22711]|jgi:hypothetical protein|uniref:Transmembrane protein n=1 Tax=Amorphotheca resinae ATCC 22711 TaxID=857342 RepID=A0A2T3AUJ9_AMORE|nr:hypothetical protein M430DRAFT_169347 [Amorphotheca resinae ATCC 22711]PSS12303.1 hypothetical protein M430DRAFT_169347 [Amorphotheca resinae ATCC 22711]